MRNGGRWHRCGPFLGARSASLVAAFVAAAMPFGAALTQEAPSSGGGQQAPAQQAPSAGTSTSAVPLPEIKVIGTTPLAPSRPVARPAPAAATAAPAAAPEAAPKPVPGAVEQDKIPSNVQTVGASAFDYTKAPDLLQAMVQALPGVALSSQTGNEFQLDFNYRGYVAGPVIGTPQARRLSERGSHQRSFRRRRQLGLDPAERDQPADARSQQSGLRPQRYGWRTRLRDEEWIHLSCGRRRS